jgi:hypothetical protein
MIFFDKQNDKNLEKAQDTQLKGINFEINEKSDNFADERNIDRILLALNIGNNKNEDNKEKNKSIRDKLLNKK